MAGIGDLVFKLVADSSGLLKDVEVEGAKAGDKAGGAFGKNFAKGIAGIATGVFAVATKSAVDLDNATRSAAAAAGILESEMGAFREQVTELFKTNPSKGFAEIANTIGTLKTDLGLSTEEAGKAAQAFLDFSKVTGQDGVAAVKGLDDILDAFNLDAADSGRVMDLLVASHQKYGGSVTESQNALKALAPALQAMNLTVDDGSALLNLFSTTGLDASKATAALNTAVKNLKPGQDLNDLIAQLAAIEDPTLRAQAAVEIFGARGGVALANALKPGVTSLDDFKISADEAAGATTTAANVIDDSFQNKITGAFRTFIEGPLASLGPAVTTAISTFAGLATAAATTGITLDVLKAKAIAAFDAINAKALTLIGVLGLLAYALSNKEGEEARHLVHELADEYGGAADEARGLTDAVTDGARVVGGSWVPALDAATNSTVALTGATEDTTDAVVDEFEALLEARKAALAKAAAAEKLTKWELAMADGAAEANNNLLDFASGANTAANDANTATTAARNLQSALSAIERNVLVQIQYRVSTAPFFNPNAPPGSADSQRQYAYDQGGGDQFAMDQARRNREQEARHREETARRLKAAASSGGGGGGGGAAAAADREATAAAKERADTVKGKLTDALRTAKDAALDYFSKVHDANLKGIKDSADLTRAEINGARERVRAWLDEQRVKANAPVTAAEQAQQAIEDARTLRDLQERLAEAQASGDARGIRGAEESLQSLHARRAIEALRATADATIAAAEAEAKRQELELDARQKAEDEKTALAITAENNRYETQKRNFDRSFDALTKYLTDTDKAHKNGQERIKALYDAFGLTMENVGKNVGDKFAAGLIASKAAVEKNAAELAKVVEDYLATKSPAAKGPLHDMSPEQMGARIVEGLNTGFLGKLRAVERTVASLAGSFALPRLSAPGFPGINPPASLAFGTAGVGPGAGSTGVNVTVNNPAPEPASASTEERLRILAATGII